MIALAVFWACAPSSNDGDSGPSAHERLCADAPGAVFFRGVSAPPVEQAGFGGPMTLALPGDWLLCEGDWEVELEVTSDDVRLVGLGPDSSILRGGENHGVLSADGVQGLELRDLEVAGGHGVGSLGNFGGSGLTLTESSTNVSGVRFYDNQSPGMGGGMLLYDGEATLVDTEFVENQAVGGGGLTIWPGTVHAERVRFYGNEADAGEGGGVALYQGATGVFRDVHFELNVAGRWGGAVLTNASSVGLHDCELDQNAAVAGGALYFNSGGIDVHDSDFRDNWPHDVYDLERDASQDVGSDASFRCSDDHGCEE